MLVYKFLNRFTFLSFICVLLPSCIDGFMGYNGNSQLIERSKEAPPTWLELDPETVIATPTHLQFVDHSDDIRNLNIDSLNFQSNALHKFELLLIEQMEKAIKENLTDTQYEKKQPLINDVVTSEFKDQFETTTKMADIYFEKWQKLGPSQNAINENFYKAYVLFQIQNESHKEILRTISKKLIKHDKTMFSFLEKHLTPPPNPHKNVTE